MRIELDCALMTGRAETHEYLKQQLQFPDYYGRNLDALYDVLTDCVKPVHMVLIHKDAMLRQLSDYGEALLETLRDAAEVPSTNRSAIAKVSTRKIKKHTAQAFESKRRPRLLIQVARMSSGTDSILSIFIALRNSRL